jgi:hypothetical protein
VKGPISHPLYSGSSELTGPEKSDIDGTVINSDLQQAIAELSEKGSSESKLNSVTLVRKRTIPTERPPLVGEVSANFCG